VRKKIEFIAAFGLFVLVAVIIGFMITEVVILVEAL